MKNKASKKEFLSMNSQVLFYIVCFLLLVVIPVVIIITFKYVDLRQMPVLNGIHFFSNTPDSIVFKIVGFYLMMISLIFIAPGLVVFGEQEIEAYQIIDAGIKHCRIMKIATAVLIITMIGLFASSHMRSSCVEAGHDNIQVEDFQL